MPRKKEKGEESLVLPPKSFSFSRRGIDRQILFLPFNPPKRGREHAYSSSHKIDYWLSLSLLEREKVEGEGERNMVANFVILLRPPSLLLKVIRMPTPE